MYIHMLRYTRLLNAQTKIPRVVLRRIVLSICLRDLKNALSFFNLIVHSERHLTHKKDED